jgi:hypothetical protein
MDRQLVILIASILALTTLSTIALFETKRLDTRLDQLRASCVQTQTSDFRVVCEPTALVAQRSAALFGVYRQIAVTQRLMHAWTVMYCPGLLCMPSVAILLLRRLRLGVDRK